MAAALPFTIRSKHVSVPTLHERRELPWMIQPEVAEGEQFPLVMVRASAASNQTPRNHIPSTRICSLLLRSLPSKLSSFGVASPPLRRREDSKKEDGYALHAT